jgi:hypothetical protein
MIVVWLPNRDAGWMLPPAEPYEHSWLEGGRRTMHELAVAIAATGREVEFRGEMCVRVLDEIAAAAGARPLLPGEPRSLTASDTVIVNEGVTDPAIFARLALSPARVALMMLAPLGLMGWPFSGGRWSPADFQTVEVKSVARPEHHRGAAALGLELWTHSPGMQRAAAVAGVECRFIGNGQPAPFPDPPAARDIDVVTIANSRWAPLALPVTEELDRMGVQTVSLRESSHEDMLRAFGRARILVHPARVEGHSRIGCEARAMGAVPVALDTHPFSVGLDEAGGSVAVAEVSEMAGVARDLLQDPERLERFSATAMRTAREQVDWATYLGRVEDALESPDADSGRGARGVIGERLAGELSDARSEAAEAALHVSGLEMQLASAEDRAAAAGDALAAATADLERHRKWLTSVNESASWRLTAPARSAKRRLAAMRRR